MPTIGRPTASTNVLNVVHGELTPCPENRLILAKSEEPCHSVAALLDHEFLQRSRGCPPQVSKRVSGIHALGLTKHGLSTCQARICSLRSHRLPNPNQLHSALAIVQIASGDGRSCRRTVFTRPMHIQSPRIRTPSIPGPEAPARRATQS